MHIERDTETAECGDESPRGDEGSCELFARVVFPPLWCMSESMLVNAKQFCRLRN